MMEACRAEKAKFQEIVKDMLLKYFAEFFANNPRVEAVKWRQYAPYFNDGEVCEFSVYDANFKRHFTPAEEALRTEYNTPDKDDALLTPEEQITISASGEFVESYGGLWSDEGLDEEKCRALEDDLQDQLEELCYEAFGSDSEIYADRTGFLVDSFTDHP